MSRCDARATWRRREGARWLHFTPTSLALIVTYSTLHTTHLAARAAPSRPRSSPRWSSEVEGSARNALSCTCDRGQTRVADDLLCGAVADSDSNPMLLCDNCDSGFHLRCVELAAVPPGDWYCDGCSTVIESQRWLRKKGLLHSSNWISVDALDFGAGDFVIVVYPKLGASKVQLYLAQVIRIGSNLQLGSDPSEQVVELEHWPEVKFPLFQKPGARG